jgi:hypothetical protein
MKKKATKPMIKRQGRLDMIKDYQKQGEAAMKKEKMLGMAQKAVKIGAGLAVAGAVGAYAAPMIKASMAKPTPPSIEKGTMKIIPREAMGRADMSYNPAAGAVGGAALGAAADYIKKKYGNTKAGKAVGAIKRAWTE